MKYFKDCKATMEEIFSMPWPLCLLKLPNSLHKKFLKTTSSIRLLLKPHPSYAVSQVSFSMKVYKCMSTTSGNDNKLDQ